MGMVVQHNMTAANTNRQLGVTTGALAKSTEKLSSGYKINRAGDDAAGLTISEKMRSQIRGLDKASTNAQDGISMIQSAEGALNESHSILQRMNELAVQGANDTNEGVDRDAINAELKQLTEELDRISSTTQFNKQNLLDGTLQNSNLQVGANTQQKISISIGAMDAGSLGLKGISYKEVETGVAPIKVSYQGMSVKYSAASTLATNKTRIVGSVKALISKGLLSTAYAAQFDNATGSVYYLATDGGRKANAAAALAQDKASAWARASKNLNSSFQDYVLTSTTTATTSKTITLETADVSDYSKANATLSAVQNAINKVSTQRSALGAVQNRLEHTIANLDTVSENTSSAESRIRDTDMASEMVNYSKNNILSQAGQSMLAQANQSNQGVLSLLQ